MEMIGLDGMLRRPTRYGKGWQQAGLGMTRISVIHEHHLLSHDCGARGRRVAVQLQLGMRPHIFRRYDYLVSFGRVRFSRFADGEGICVEEAIMGFLSWINAGAT